MTVPLGKARAAFCDSARRRRAGSVQGQAQLARHASSTPSSAASQSDTGQQHCPHNQTHNAMLAKLRATSPAGLLASSPAGLLASSPAGGLETNTLLPAAWRRATRQAAQTPRSRSSSSAAAPHRASSSAAAPHRACCPGGTRSGLPAPSAAVQVRRAQPLATAERPAGTGTAAHSAEHSEQGHAVGAG